MTRTYITAADGTLYEAIPARRALTRKIIRRTIWAITLIVTALFLSAAIIGLNQAIHTPAPTMTHTAAAIDPGINLATAKKACRRAPKGSGQDCLALYLRRAWHTPSTYTPAGPALVKECISQYRGRELADCFTQEIG